MPGGASHQKRSRRTPGSQPRATWGGASLTDISSSGPGYGRAPTATGAIDWTALIDNEPGLIAYRGGETEAMNNTSTARRAALQALAIRSGGPPAVFSDQYGDID